ncbi:MAG: hypothetical protein LAT83_23300 [Kiritimatiellae bacterium]|nr:hypothetical protein [Kiritimatiellia bacterium]
MPGHAYFYLFRGTQSFQAEGQVVDAYDAEALPAVTAVSYDAANDRVLVTVETAGGTANTLDLFYQDADLPEGFTPDENWQIWALGVEAGAGDSFVFEDSGDAQADPARPHPREVTFRFYQVGDATLDSSGNGFSDVYTQLMGESNADPVGDGTLNEEESHEGSTLSISPVEDLLSETLEKAESKTPKVIFTVYTPLR